MKKKIYIAAGGTGGHINAALSLGEYLKTNYEIEYFSGTRHLDYKLFSGTNVNHIQARPLRTKNPITLFRNVLNNLFVFIRLFSKIIKDRPEFAIGTGGYVCGPVLMCCRFYCPVFIVEQNAVMGLTNKLLSKIANKIFVNFENTKGANPAKVIKSGNPIRSEITYSDNIVSEKPNLLVFGGSLGAKQINDVVFDLLASGDLKDVNITHQVGKGQIKEVSNIDNSVEYNQVEYIDDMQKAYSTSNLILSRAGASTVSELEVVQRPVVIIPYPLATDNHQYYNALNLKERDWFYCGIIDYNLGHEDLKKEVLNHINHICEKKLFDSQERQISNANEIIKNEIEKCLV